jgi:predicted RecA/RadA family phage recombinase
MAALSAARGTKSRSLGRKVSYLLKASTQVYAGGMVMVDVNGLAQPANAEAGNNGCVGVATESVLSTASGNERITVQEGIFLFDAASIAQANVAERVFAHDDQTIDETTGSDTPLAGVLVEFVSSTSGWVYIALGTSISKAT